MAHEYMYLTPIGEDTLILCDYCHYAANRQIALVKKTPPPSEQVLQVVKIATPDMKTIESLANFLGVPKSKTAKAVFLIATIPEGKESQEKFIFAVVRGDMDVNETKISNAVKAKELRPATDEEIVAVGAVPGYASPIDLKNTLVIVDDLIPQSPNLVSGANEEGYHLLNVNYGRDYKANIITDITAANEGDTCHKCGNKLKAVRGVEVGNIFKLGTRYSDSMGCSFLNKDGEEKPVIMGSYGIGSGRLLACVAEEHHDNNGLFWPITVAPYHVHLITISGKIGDRIENEAELLYQKLIDNGVEVLLDDREESPGVKFNDADLIGIPIRLTISQRTLDQKGVEFKLRSEKEKKIIPINEVVNRVSQTIEDLIAEIQLNVRKVPFKEE